MYFLNKIHIKTQIPLKSNFSVNYRHNWWPNGVEMCTEFGDKSVFFVTIIIIMCLQFSHCLQCLTLCFTTSAVVHTDCTVGANHTLIHAAIGCRLHYSARSHTNATQIPKFYTISRIHYSLHTYSGIFCIHFRKFCFYF